MSDELEALMGDGGTGVVNEGSEGREGGDGTGDGVDGVVAANEPAPDPEPSEPSNPSLPSLTTSDEEARLAEELAEVEAGLAELADPHSAMIAAETERSILTVARREVDTLLAVIEGEAFTRRNTLHAKRQEDLEKRRLLWKKRNTLLRKLGREGEAGEDPLPAPTTDANAVAERGKVIAQLLAEQAERLAKQ